MATSRAKYTQDNRVIVQFFGVHGPVGDEINDKAERTRNRAVLTCPVGPPRIGDEGHAPGNLKRSHFRNGYRKIGPYKGTSSIINRARYAVVVHEGYPGVIRPKGETFKVPRSSWEHYKGPTRGKGIFYYPRDSLGRGTPVQGQGAQPWLWNASTYVLRGGL